MKCRESSLHIARKDEARRFDGRKRTIWGGLALTAVASVRGESLRI